uniref:Glycine cleavage system H protein n=1 Tax=Caligus rogercresseyi TaxID=217165 RepID=C1BP45_CALRO|nr:Glycine cleavage system H protein, mitochondrial precursor [Caligus rogercresseyi]
MKGLSALCRGASRCFSISSRQSIPLYFSEKHEWVDYTPGNDAATVGISDYAQSALGDIVYVQLPEVDTKIKSGEEIGALESVKAASELYSPVAGTVIDKNAAVEDAPALINSSPEADGWLFKIKLSNEAQIEGLMNEEKYKVYLESQEEDH